MEPTEDEIREKRIEKSRLALLDTMQKFDKTPSTVIEISRRLNPPKPLDRKILPDVEQFRDFINDIGTFG